MRNHPRHRIIYLPLLIFCSALVNTIVYTNVNAHDYGEAPHGGNPPLHAIDTMRAFKKDSHEAQSLAAMSGTPCVANDAGGYPCNNIDLLAFMPLANIGGGSGNDIWGWTDALTGKEYAIMGRTSGTSFVDISDPINPVYLGNLPPHTANSSWRDIKVYADHAYMVTEANNSGLQVFDLTQLRTVSSPPVTFSETNWYNEFLKAHNLVINEDTGYAYAVGTNNGNCGGGLHFIDISDPPNPVAAGCFSADGYTHDAQCVVYNGPDTQHQGKEICFAYNEDSLTIVDVTDKSAPVQLSRTDYVGRHYTHQGWLTEDQRYLLMDDELDEYDVAAITNTRTFMWNVADLDAPVNMGFYEAPTTTIDHNQYIKGHYSYQANYEAGLRIIDITDISNANLNEVSYFDIYPGSDATEFHGAWSNFPYFNSGIVIVSGVEQGLFILKPTNIPLQVGIDIKPFDMNNTIHPHHNDFGTSPFLNDTIAVVVFGQNNLDTTLIDNATVAFGPAGANIAPGSTPVSQDYDNDLILDKRFDFLMGDTGLGCSSTEADLIGATTSGDSFTGNDFVTADCNAGCH